MQGSTASTRHLDNSTSMRLCPRLTIQRGRRTCFIAIRQFLLRQLRPGCCAWISYYSGASRHGVRYPDGHQLSRHRFQRTHVDQASFRLRGCTQVRAHNLPKFSMTRLASHQGTTRAAAASPNAGPRCEDTTRSTGQVRKNHTACNGIGVRVSASELFSSVSPSGRLAISVDQIIVFGSVIQVPDADVCGAHGRARAHLVARPHLLGCECSCLSMRAE